MDRNSDLQELNGYLKQFTVLVAVPRTYMTKVAYGHGIGAAGIGQFYPVANKILALFGGGGGGLVPEQAIFIPQTLREIIRVKNPTDIKIEAVF